MDSSKEILMKLFFRSAQVIIEFGGNEMNHVNADPDKDDENNQTLNSSLLAASPH